MSERGWLHTDIGGADPDAITVRGRDLASDLMGKVTFTELTFLLVRGRAPTAQETVLLDAVLVSLAEHGLTPTVLAARLTHTGAPESLQGAVAAGLLGAGSVFLGVVEDTAVFLDAVVAAGEERGDPLDAAAAEAVRACLADGRRIPGLGHPVHKGGDPRTARIYAIAEEQGLEGPHLRALRLVSAAHREATGKTLPINGAGVAGAALADLGFPARIVRGMALLARTAGLVAHLEEEHERPLGMPLFLDVERGAREGGPR
jgi:citrate synthase